MPASRYHLYDDPQSQIRFLETTLGDKEWRAIIHLLPEQGPAELRDLRAALKQRGIESRPHTDADGHRTLKVHHVGPRPDIAGLFKEYGFSRGAEYIIDHPMGTASALIRGARGGIDTAVEYLKDPAHANGSIFLTAEAVLLAAGGANKHGRWYDAKNLLQSTAAAFWLSQSIAYTVFAKTGDERIARDFTSRISPSNQPVVLGDNLEAARPVNEQPRHTWAEKARGYLEDHPIQVGAIMNNFGMLTFMAHSVLERKHSLGLLAQDPTGHPRALKYVNSGFKKEIAGCMVSILGWSCLLLPPKEHEGEYSANPLAAAWEKFREHPQSVTGLTSMVSSSQRLMGGKDKGNNLQMLGEAIYIPGDVMLFFIRNNEYGKSRNGAYDGLLDMIGGLMEKAPVVASSQAQKGWLDQTADYLVRQYQAMSETPEPDEAQMRQKLRDGLLERVEKGMNARYDLLLGAARRFALDFPPEERRNVVAKLSEVLPQLDGVYTTAKELDEQLCAITDMECAPRHPQVNPDTLSRGVAEMVMRIPHPQVGQNALKIYEAFATTPGKDMPQHLSDALDKAAEAETGVDKAAAVESLNQPEEKQQGALRA